MKSFIALFLIAIISCTPYSPILKEKEPIDIIRCIISNKDLTEQLKDIILEMEKVIKEKDLSGLVSLLNIFSMVEEVKDCFEETPVEPQPEPAVDEVVLKDGIDDFIGCISNIVSGSIDVTTITSDVQNCWYGLPEETRKQIIDAGVGAVSVACSTALSGHPAINTICQVACSIIGSL
jgi:hypothetical protein